MYDVVIIGGGPTGNYAAYKLAKDGFKVVVMEEHSEIGKPVHCTGIVGEETFQKFNVPSNSIIKEIPYFKVFSPAGHCVCFPSTIKAYVVNREKFDKDLYMMAESKGVKYFLNTKTNKIENNRNGIKILSESNGENITIHGKVCVAATGSMSNLPYESGISKPRSFYKSAQTDVEVSNLEGAEVYTGVDYAPGSFAYVVSIGSGIAKAGLVTRLKAKVCFENFMNSKYLKNRIKGTLEIVRYRRLPFYIPKASVFGRLLALGDACGQVKTTTGGGVYVGLVCSEILAGVIKKAYSKKDFNAKKLGTYDRLWKKEFGLELQAGLLLRAFFEKVEDKYLNKLFLLGNTDKIKEVIEKKGDYDRHRDLIIALMKVPEIREVAFEIIKKNLPKKRFFTYLLTYINDLASINIFK